MEPGRGTAPGRFSTCYTPGHLQPSPLNRNQEPCMYSAAKRVTRIALVSLALPFALACSSSTAGTATDPAIRIEQFPSTEFTAKQEGAGSIAYQITVLNRSSEPIRLRQLGKEVLAR